MEVDMAYVPRHPVWELLAATCLRIRKMPWSELQFPCRNGEKC